MDKNQKISPHQFKILVVMCFVGSSILLTPGGLATEAKQDAWIAVLVGGIAGFGIVFLYNFLSDYLGNMTLIQYNEKIFGSWIGKLISLLIIFFSLINCASLLYVVGDFITTQIMPETPIQFTYFLFVMVIVIGTRLGLETFARASEILYSWVIAFFIILILFLLPDIQIKNIEPIFENGIKATLRGALLFMSYSSFTLIILLIIFPSCINDPKLGKKAFYHGTFIGFMMIFIITLISILVLGYDYTSRNVFPTYILAKKINLANFIQRIEAVLAVLWIITIYYKISLYFYGTVFGLAQTLHLEDYRPLTLPIGMILIVLSLVIYPNSIYAGVWNTTTWVSMVTSFGFFFPLLLLLVTAFRQ